MTHRAISGNGTPEEAAIGSFQKLPTEDEIRIGTVTVEREIVAHAR